ncbi:MAG: amidohydrolase [archaeon]|nr:amidohydrolase [archaeon]
MLLKNCRYIITQNGSRAILEKSDILVQNGKIKKIGKALFAQSPAEIIDCSEKIVMPGLVNTHTHLGMHSLKGACDDEELFEWLERLAKEEEKLDAKKVKENTKAGLREAIRFGTTTIYDSYKEPMARAQAFGEAGINGIISSTITGTESFSRAVKFSESSLPENVAPAIAANSIYACPEDVLKKVAKYSDKKRLLRRIHVGETRKERFDILEKKGKLAVEYLDSIGFLGKTCLLVHCIWITKGEIARIAKAKAKVSHNPVSNMKLASGGVMPLAEMLAAGVCAGLGTDSVASNNNLDMFEEMKTAALLHRHHKWDPKAISAQQILDMATIKGAQCLCVEKRTGSIEVGKQADIITLGPDENLLPINDPVSSMVFSANGLNVDDVIARGKILLREKSFFF